MEKNKVIRMMLLFLCKIMLAAVTIVAFVKLPKIIADKMSYRNIKRRTFKQEFNDKEDES